jgi:hypothetical protein
MFMNCLLIFNRGALPVQRGHHFGITFGRSFGSLMVIAGLKEIAKVSVEQYEAPLIYPRYLLEVSCQWTHKTSRLKQRIGNGVLR